MELRSEGEQDDSLLPVFYETTDSPEVKKNALRSAVSQNERVGIDVVAKMCQLRRSAGFAQFINREIVELLGLTPDQSWFGLGKDGHLFDGLSDGTHRHVG